MIQASDYIKRLEAAGVELDAVIPAATVEQIDHLTAAKALLERMIEHMRAEDAPSRAAYVAEKREKEAEARAEATRIIQSIKHAHMTPEERRAEAERDTDFLFGTVKERTEL